MNDYVYDVETYPNCFTCAFESAQYPISWMFEISDYKDDSEELMQFLHQLQIEGARLVGFMNLGFDYPVIHMFMKMNGKVSAKTLYDKAQSIIEAGDDDRFANTIYPSDRYIPQIDLFKIHHFDNKAKSTSLKKLEFNMRSHSIQDLPFPVGSYLEADQVLILRQYNAHDVSETKKFYHHTLPMIRFREELTHKYQRDFMNHNDTKIGKDYFVMRLEQAGIDCYEYGSNGRQPKQTLRPQIHLKDAILPSISFEDHDFTRVLEWLKDQTITETKGVFEKLIANVNGFDFVFGTGGIHGSVDNRIVTSDDEYVIVDLDVKSFYPNLAIANGFYPEHLGPEFCKIYKVLYDQRSSYAKDSPENAMLKLALNGVYGDSNNPYSVFYDPLYTMKITLNGQLLLCMLAEDLMVMGCQMVQANTDGLTVRVERTKTQLLNAVCLKWEKMTGLTLEQNTYRRMFIRDVNSYLAQYENGNVKRKGVYDYEMDWHQDHSSMVVAKVAEQVLIDEAPIAQTVKKWSDFYDFLICVKVPRSSYLEADGVQVQNTCRFYVSNTGVELSKWMPPLKGKTEWRKIGVCKGRKVVVCNDMCAVGDDWQEHIDYSYYVNEVEKLVMGLK